MVEERLNIYEYEEVLLGQKESFTLSISGSESVTDRFIEIGNIWRYAITHLLKWTPKQAEVYMNADIVQFLKLDKTLIKVDIDLTKVYYPDYKFILCYAFPKQIRYDEKVDAIEEYKRAARLGKYAGDEVPYRYPNKFFIDSLGIRRAGYILNYVIDLYMKGAYSPYERYKFFADTTKARRWLHQKKLKQPIEIIYETPLDFYHFSLPFVERDDFLYYAYTLNALYKKGLRDSKKRKN